MPSVGSRTSLLGPLFQPARRCVNVASPTLGLDPVMEVRKAQDRPDVARDRRRFRLIALLAILTTSLLATACGGVVPSRILRFGRHVRNRPAGRPGNTQDPPHHRDHAGEPLV